MVDDHTVVVPTARMTADEPRRFFSLGTKLAVGMGLVVILASAFVFVELTARERKNLVDAKVTAATMVTDLFAASLAAPLDFGDPDAINLEIQNVRSNRQVERASVWSQAEKRTVAGFGGGEAEAIGDNSEPWVAVTADAVDVRRPVIGRKKTVGHAVLTFSLAEENAAYAASRARIFWLCLALAGGTSGLLVMLTRRQIVRPLERLLGAAQRVERGEHAPAVTVQANDEIGRLATAFNSMNEAIFDREDRLETLNASQRELLDHMRQAILVFGEGGVVSGAHSREAMTVFGRDAFDGVKVRDLIYPQAGPGSAEASAFDEWLELAFAAPADAWDEVAELAPREVILELPAGGQRVLELEFRRIGRGSQQDRIMLLATDESEKRHLKRVGEQYAQQMAVMRRFASGGGQIFVTFLESSRRRLGRCRQLLGEAPRTLRLGEVEEMFQHFHTIKGEAHTFELMELRAHMHGLEERLVELRATATERGSADSGEAFAGLQRGMVAAASAIEAGEQLFVETSPLGRAALELVTVRRPDVQKLCDMVGARGDELGKLALRLASRPFGEIVSTLAERVPTWADGERKRARLEIEGGDVMIPPALARVLSGCLVHLARNAIAHGIETPAVRVAAGKDETGVIRMRCEDTPHGPRLSIEDDGSGMKSAERAHQRGRSNPSPNSLSGRGVGLGAVETELRTADYVVVTEATEGAGTRFSLIPGAATDASGGGTVGDKQWVMTTAAS